LIQPLQPPKAYKTDTRARDFFTVGLNIHVDQQNHDSKVREAPAVFDAFIAGVIRRVTQEKSSYYKQRNAMCSLHFHSLWSPIINPIGNPDKPRSKDEAHDIDESTPFESVFNLTALKHWAVEVMTRHFSYVMLYSNRNPHLHMKYVEITIRPNKRNTRW
jgi:hypothetical protein